ncbi:MAG: NADH-quinone oxidoreductase subunit NuoN [Rhodomicrobium sp.]
MLPDISTKFTAALSEYAPIFPELFIVLAAFVLLMWGVYHRYQIGIAIGVVSIFVLGGAALLIARHPAATQELFNGAFVDDSFGRFMKLLTLAGSALTIVLSFDYMRRERILRFEYPVLILLSTAGMMLTISANDLISLYLALEFQSLALYVVAAFHRDNLRSTEAGLKYFVLGVLSSGLLLYGSSLVYGYTGATSFPRIAEAVQLHGASIGFVFGLVFVLSGLVFKISAVPFHMWTPDVYEGAPTPVTVYFASASKIAAMAMVIRVILGAFPNSADQWQQIVIAISVASMALGAFAAIGQTNIKRLLAYSSIGHVGYALIGVAAATPGGAAAEGISSVLIYLTIYLAMTVGSFACVLGMRHGRKMSEAIQDLAGISKDQPLYAFLFAMLLFSLAGIPPLAGFFAKFYVFDAAIKAHLTWLAVVGAVLSVIGAYYYLRVVKVMYFDEPGAAFEPMPSSVSLVIGAMAGFTILFFLYPSPLKAAADAASRSLF